MTTTRWVRSCLVVALALGAAACGRTPEPSAPAGATLRVFAAASLTKVFSDLGTRYESAHPGTTVEFTFAGSSDLLAQIRQGAPADVLASADERNMDTAVSAGDVDRSAVEMFATNTLTIVTAPGNPERIASLADLARPDLVTVVCAPQVPCGAATEKVEKAAGITIAAVSEENAVTDVLGKVTSGQADAGLVYRTDARRAGDDVEEVTFAQAKDAVNRYPIAPTTRAQGPDAPRFVDLVTGPEGRQVLEAAGFGPAR